jgi:hypothetical protein
LVTRIFFAKREDEESLNLQSFRLISCIEGLNTLRRERELFCLNKQEVTVSTKCGGFAVSTRVMFGNWRVERTLESLPSKGISKILFHP